MAARYFLLWLLVSMPVLMAALFVLWFAIPPIKPYLYPNNDIGWVRDLYVRKDRDLAAIESPRLILVGGSSVHFGFDAGRISEALGVQTFNYGTHAGLDLTYLLDRADRATRPGDTVLLIVEYPLFRTTLPFTVLPVFYSSFHDKSFWWRMPASLWSAYVSQYDLHLLWRAIGNNLANCKHAPLGNIPGPYRAQNIDRYGSERGNLAANITPAMRARVEADNQIFPRLNRSSIGATAVARFVADQRAKGVTVMAGWPPTLRRKEYTGPAAAALFADLQLFWSDLGVPVIGEPSRSMVDAQDVYDTSFHMNERGQALMTERLIQDLRQAGLP
ncbi:MAG TPA: hypothetical protein VHL31_16830 [Geminicoccus sp.]|uniref:hypothetical protein n=1 Tax=Geminicoccus sp. TaxID=2024832 RepID=UPI002E34D157|nr:hypothetical protein [Geminicoccus sp.]HEX2527951.1 hypothetical protein [Geminicoccus sp.]